MSISIARLDKAIVLAALYNPLKPRGLGFKNYIPDPMSAAKAQDIFDRYPESYYFEYMNNSAYYFNYLDGLVLKNAFSKTVPHTGEATP